MYQIYKIPKPNGSKRTIYSPNQELRLLQKELVKQLESRYIISDHCYAYRKGKNTRDLTLNHLNKKWIITIDIFKFFPSIKKHHLLSLGFSESECEICLYKGFVPEGSLTAPTIANIVLSPILEEINYILNRIGVRVDSYSDDIVLSAIYDANPKWAYIKYIEFILNKNGFKINKSKIKFMFPNTKMEVLGINCNTNKPTISYKFRKRIKNQIKYGAISDDIANGYMSYIKMITKG